MDSIDLTLVTCHDVMSWLNEIAELNIHERFTCLRWRQNGVGVNHEQSMPLLGAFTSNLNASAKGHQTNWVHTRTSKGIGLPALATFQLVTSALKDRALSKHR